MAGLTQLSEVKMFGGRNLRYRHDSAVVGTPMEFGVFLPPQAAAGKVKSVWYLSGLTCTDVNFMTKAGAQRVAAELGLALIAPDTSPRLPADAKIPGEDDTYDFGSGAGFYLDATQDPWSKNYKMYSYILKELLPLVVAGLPVLEGAQHTGIMGHSMGGHGAITIGLKNPTVFQSISAFSPICNPMNCPWGTKAFGNYLGSDQAAWKEYDSCELAKSYDGPAREILANQGTADSFLTEKQLLPEALQAAVQGHPKLTLTLSMDEGYDHSYNHIATFIESHLRHHAKFLS
eukprot:NODE_1253_length_1021_cov_259.442387_g841_i1.p1 GENE.NODE_1253_length_1021_cov_259.442387_g841_i1~~NODE_1253_length_1021_cov_259.442387_g841_i1.p1  ORF type:complete len:307 (+),score=139.70 NODE_1253_length_1021_cov_259.442387_g841_i1:55-921(+)